MGEGCTRNNVYIQYDRDPLSQWRPLRWSCECDQNRKDRSQSKGESTARLKVLKFTFIIYDVMKAEKTSKRYNKVSW